MKKSELYFCFRNYQKNNDWFENVFLVSLINKVNSNINSKYPNQIILTDKQAYVCEKYMQAKQTNSYCCQGFSRNDFRTYETDYHKCYLRYRGKWVFFEAYSKLNDAKRDLQGLQEYLHKLNVTEDKEEIEETKADIKFLIEYISNFNKK